MLSSPPANHLKNGGFEESSTVSHGLNQSMALAFSAQYAWGSFRDCSHSCFRLSPEKICALLGVYFSPNGKLASDMFIIPVSFWIKSFFPNCIKTLLAYATFIEKILKMRA